MGSIQYITFAVSAVLQVLVLSHLLKGGYRRFPFLFLMVIAQVLGTIASMAAMLDLRWTKETQKVFWISELVQYFLIFVCQVHMLAQCLDKGQKWNRIRYLILGSAAFALLATWQAYDPRLGFWMTQLIRNFSFGAMFVNLTIWTMLLRHPDQQRLLIAAGFGVLLAGEAIGHSLRQLSRSLVVPGNLILIATYPLFLFTIWRAMHASAVLVRKDQDLQPSPDAGGHEPA